MDLLTEFKTYLVTEKGASANTVASYMRDITQYVHYLGEDDRQVLGATSECIEAYRKQLLKMGKSAATVTRALASLKCLYRWLQQSGKPSQGRESGKGGAEAPSDPLQPGGRTAARAAPLCGRQGVPRSRHAGGAVCHRHSGQRADLPEPG